MHFIVMNPINKIKQRKGIERDRDAVFDTGSEKISLKRHLNRDFNEVK